MANSKSIVEAWKCVPRGTVALEAGSGGPVYVVRYADGTGNIVGSDGPMLRGGVEFGCEPEDFLVGCRPFYSVEQVAPSRVPG